MGKSLFFCIGMILSLFLVSNASATDISSCQELNIAGTYTLTTDLTSSDSNACFFIRGSDITLDLNGHTIEQASGGGNGIYVLPYNASYYLTDVTIENGVIDHFNNANILIAFTRGLTIDGITATNANYGIQLGYDAWNTTLKNSDIYYNRYGVVMLGFERYMLVRNNFFDNVITDLDVTNGALWNSSVIMNTFGNVTVTSSCCTTSYMTIFPFIINQPITTCTPICGVYHSGAGRNIDCTNCNGNDFVGNYYYAFSQDAVYSGTTECRFIRETYTRYPAVQPNNGLFLNPGANNNWGCGLSGNIYDTGQNNIFIGTCPNSLYPGETVGLCQEGWQCIDTYTAAYRLPDCTFVNETLNCASSNKVCINGQCIAITTTTVAGVGGGNASVGISPIPIVDQAEWTAAGYGWALPFLTPIFIVSIVITFISAIAARLGGAVVGGTTALLLVGIMTLPSPFQIFPPWFGLIFVVLGAFVIAKFGGVLKTGGG